MHRTVFGFALLCWLATPSLAAPDEDQLGRKAGYPLGTVQNWFFEESVRVGSFSNLEKIVPYNRLAKPATASPLPTAEPAPRITYRYEGQTATIDDFLARNRITGLLIIKDGQILAERYQYDRKPGHRFVSHSMAKSITSLAIGIALREGRIKSLDDPVATYVKGLAGTAYGETTIRNILRMASGVPFKEVYDGKDDLQKYGELRSKSGHIAALKAFNQREGQQGSRFHYASSETQVLGTVIQAVTGGSLSSYLTSRLWQPMGAESDAIWRKSEADGFETSGGAFNAVLRDYGRLGVLLANDGAVGGRQVIPKDYLIEATDWRRHPDAFHPRKATSYFGYGYQFWTYPAEKRRFALIGVYGQSIFVDPELKLVMVVTAVAKAASVAKDNLARERDALWRGLVASFGSW